VVVALWYALPGHRFIAIPFAIVALYLVAIFVLLKRRVRIGITPSSSSAAGRV
jgi:hypothetical protein